MMMHTTTTTTNNNNNNSNNNNFIIHYVTIRPRISGSIWHLASSPNLAKPLKLPRVIGKAQVTLGIFEIDPHQSQSIETPGCMDIMDWFQMFQGKICRKTSV